MTAFLAARLSANRLRDFAIIGIALFVLLQNALPRLQAFAQDDGAESPQPASTVPSAFTYQGRISVDGLPQDDPFDLEFALFDVGVGGAPLATLPLRQDVAVENGLFTVRLDFGSSLFVGEERWLEVRARPGTSSGELTVVGRQELTVAPFALYSQSAGSATTAAALSLPFSAVVTNTSNEALLSVTHNHVDGTSVATLGNRFNAVSGTGRYIGVYGEGLVAGVQGSGPTIGVAGSTANPVGKGVEGMNFGGGWGVYGDGFPGVFGRAAEPGGKGVQGYGLAFGVYGESPAATGVYGEGGTYGVLGTNPASGVGIRGRSIGGATGIGVLGDGLGDGVRGETSTTGKAGVSGIAAGGANNNWAGYFVGNVNVEGAITATGSITPSDARLKKDITTLTGALAKVMALRPVTFAWRDGHDADRAHPGFIAQEVREVLPEVVYEGSDEMRTLALSPSELVPVLVSAMQEQQARIEALEAKVAEMAIPVFACQANSARTGDAHTAGWR